MCLEEGCRTHPANPPDKKAPTIKNVEKCKNRKNFGILLQKREEN